MVAVQAEIAQRCRAAKRRPEAIQVLARELLSPEHRSARDADGRQIAADAALAVDVGADDTSLFRRISLG